MNYKISEAAIADLDAIWLYTFENWSRMQADRYYSLLVDEIKFVSENFEYGKDFKSVRKGYRYIKVKSHLIFYKKNKDHIVEIVRILHEKMDISNRI
jgi:toxin ParE1/3/4